MYRKQQQVSEKTPDEQELKSDFLKRVSLLPLVNMTTQYTAATYNRIKRSNVLAARTLSLAEKTLDVVAGHAHPLLLKLAGQIQLADNLACCGLNILEEKAPLITKPPEEILKDVTELYNSTLQKSFDHYNELKSYGSDKIQTIKDNACQKTLDLSLPLYWKTVANVLDKTLEVAEQQVDYYLPPTENEENVNKNVGELSIERIGGLYGKIRGRFYLNVISKLQNVQIQTWEVVSKLNFTVTLMQYAREKSNIMNWTKDSLQKNIYWLWEDLNKETDPDAKPATVGEQVLHLARQLTKQLVTLYNSLTPLSQVLPTALQQNFESAQNYSLHVYEQLHQAKNFNEMTSVMITELKQNVQYLEMSILDLLNHTFLQKLASLEAVQEKTSVST
ncbi:perilipin-2-like [Tachypleus tridentatus]|uniref:perilipin-2-like n=1 Tax=Tachypleus tridentatus TaxID=6853 RepID=UPI003FD1C721